MPKPLMLMCVKRVDQLKVGDEVSAGTITKIEASRGCITITVGADYTGTYSQDMLVVVEA